MDFRSLLLSVTAFAGGIAAILGVIRLRELSHRNVENLDRLLLDVGVVGLAFEFGFLLWQARQGLPISKWGILYVVWLFLISAGLVLTSVKMGRKNGRREKPVTFPEVVPQRRATDQKPKVAVERVWIVVLAFVLSLVVGFMFVQQQRDVNSVQTQNDVQLCAQHNIIIAIKGDSQITDLVRRSLGLPDRGIADIIDSIQPPSIEGIDCVALLQSTDG